MAMDKNSNAFTFGFAITMVVIVGVTLAAISMGLKDRQQQNKADKQKMDILGAIGVDATRKDAGVLFDQYVTERVAIDYNGKVLKSQTGTINPADKADPFNTDVLKDYKGKIVKTSKKFSKDPQALKVAMSDLDVSYPLYKCVNDAGDTLFVVPMAGTGLWGPVWGYVALRNDYKTIAGAKFDHEGETPGLGAEIKGAEFQNKLTPEGSSKVVNYDGPFAFQVMKSGTPNLNASQIDGITGGTITSVGVGEMLDRSFKIYARYFQSL